MQVTTLPASQLIVDFSGTTCLLQTVCSRMLLECYCLEIWETFACTDVSNVGFVSQHYEIIIKGK